MKVSFKGKKLFIGRMGIELSSNISDCLTIGSKVVVLLDPESCKESRNVLCFDRDGKLLWRLPQLPKDKGWDSFPPYMTIRLEAGKLIAESSFGVFYDVDINDGSTKNVSTGRVW